MFSVIIPLHNKEKQVHDALESVLHQTFSDYELIIVDDGSTDGSLDVVKSLALDTRVQIICQANAGVSVARNNGISHANGSFICFLDADDLWLPDHLAILKNLIGQYPEAGLYATRHKLIEADGTERVVPMNEDTYLFDNLFQAELDTGYNYLHTNSVCIPRQVLDISGVFTVGERTGEDTSLWLRIAAQFDVAMTKPVTTVYRREFSDAFVGLTLNPAWSFLRYAEQLLLLDKITEKKKDSIRKYINRYRISLCRHALLVGDKDEATKYYSAVNWTLQGKKEKILTDVCRLIPSSVLKTVYHRKYKNSFRPKGNS